MRLVYTYLDIAHCMAWVIYACMHSHKSQLWAHIDCVCNGSYKGISITRIYNPILNHLMMQTYVNVIET